MSPIIVPTPQERHLQQKMMAIRTSLMRHDRRPLEGLRVLLVEDSEDNQALFQWMLSKEGVNVEVASNGVEGVEQALEGKHHLVLMDLQMPVMGGHEATRTLRQLGFRRPIVALTACSASEERGRCLQSGFNHFLNKPLEQETLYSLLKQIPRP